MIMAAIKIATRVRFGMNPQVVYKNLNLLMQGPQMRGKQRRATDKIKKAPSVGGPGAFYRAKWEIHL